MPLTLHVLNNNRILLVEDDGANLLVASTLLENFGYDFDVARNGNEAVQKAKSTAYAVIIMDMRMPDMGGEQATRLIRDHERAFGQIPAKIICVTANAFVGQRELCLAAGMNDYLSKPYQAEALQQKLNGLLQ